MRPQHVTSGSLFLPESYDLMRERKWSPVKVLTGSASDGLVSFLHQTHQRGPWGVRLVIFKCRSPEDANTD